MASLQETPGVLLVLVLSAGLIYVLAHKPSREVPDRLPQPESSSIPDITIRGLSLIQTRGDRIDWSVGADRAEMFDADHRIQITKARVEVRPERGLGVRFEGDSGAIDTESRNFVVTNQRDDIAVDLSNGYTVMTKEIKWINRDRRFESDTPVLIRGPQITISGRGLQIDTLSQEVSVRGDVHGTIIGPS